MLLNVLNIAKNASLKKIKILMLNLTFSTQII